MTTDAWLAIFHHLAVFTLLGAVAGQFALVRAGMDRIELQRLSRLDAVYGVSAGAAILAGVARVIWGAQPAGFYLENPVFWLKMAAFGGTGLLSIVPTRQYARWRERAANSSAAPSIEETARVRRFVTAELVLFPAIPITAALMARGIGV